MALPEGGKLWSARRAGVVPQDLPREKYWGETGTIKKGHPLVSISGNQVRKPTVVSGYLSDPKIWGHSNMDDDDDIGPEFAVMPFVTRHGRKEILAMPADGITKFTMAVCSGQRALPSHVEKKVNFKYDSANDQYSLDPSSNDTAKAYVVIVDVHPSDVDEFEGRLDYIIPDAVSQFLTGQ